MEAQFLLDYFNGLRTGIFVITVIKNNFPYLFIIVLLLGPTACNNRFAKIDGKQSEEKGNSDSQRLNLSIESFDLSEDFSRFSTKNDELLLLFYQRNSLDSSLSTLLMEEFIFDNVNRSISFDEILYKKTNAKNYLIVLIEMDDEMSKHSIDSILKKEFTSIYNYWLAKEYLRLEKYLGDNDLLGLENFEFSNNNKLKIDFSGVQKLDRFEYQIELSSLN